MDIVVRGSKDDSVVIGVSSFSGSGTGSTLKHDTMGIYPPRKIGLKIIPSEASKAAEGRRVSVDEVPKGPRRPSSL